MCTVNGYLDGIGDEGATTGMFEIGKQEPLSRIGSHLSWNTPR